MSIGSGEVSCLNRNNPFGKLSTLYIHAEQAEGRCWLSKVSFTAPFKVMAPFVKGDKSLQVMILMVSTGILEGDTQEITVETGSGAVLECTSQSFEKIHRMKEGFASRHTRLCVGRNSTLFYRPLPVIPYEGSAFKSMTEIELEDCTSRVVYQEILACGRAARKERFAYRFYDSRLDVREQGRLIYRENNRFRPDCCEMEETGMWEGFSHMATLLMIHFEIGGEKMEMIRNMIDSDEGVAGGITCTAASGSVVRILGNQAAKLMELCEKISEFLLL